MWGKYCAFPTKQFYFQVLCGKMRIFFRSAVWQDQTMMIWIGSCSFKCFANVHFLVFVLFPFSLLFLYVVQYYSKQIEEYLTYKSDIIMFRHHHVLTSSCFCIKCFENLHCVFLYVFCNWVFSSWGWILLAEVRPWWCLKSFDNFMQSFLFLALFVAFSSSFVFLQFL